MSDDPAPTEPAPPKAPKARTPVLVLLLLVLNLGATGFVVFKVLTATPAAAAPAHKPEPTGNEVSGPIVKLDPFVVNLNEPSSPRYLKVGIELELSAGEHARAVDKAKQILRDQVLSYLSNLSIAETLGEAGKAKIRTDLMKRFDEVVGRGHVRRMFFTEFVIQ